MSGRRAKLCGMRPYEGLLTAMVTPFHADGSVDEDAAVAMARHLLANGSHGLVVAAPPVRPRRWPTTSTSAWSG